MALSPFFGPWRRGRDEARGQGSRCDARVLFTRMFDEGEIARAMLQAGFRSADTRQAQGPLHHGPAVLSIARKTK